jgi:periplasmic protein TonB
MSAVAMPLRPRHWSLAFAGALLLHAALALVLFHQWVQGGTVAAGRGGIEVGLPPAGAAPGAPAEAAAAEAAAAPPPEAADVVPEAVPEVAAVPEVEAAPVPPPASAEPPSAEPLYAPVETVEAVVPPEEPVTAEAPPPAETEAAEVEPVEPVEEAVAEPVMAVPQPPKAKPRPPAAEEKPAPEVAEAAPVEPEPEPAEVAAAAVGPAEGPPTKDETVGNKGKAGTGDGAATGEAEGHSGGGAPGALVDYKAQLYAWLEKHKEYPRRARLRRQEGTTTLQFVMDRSGRVLEYSIVESSGYKLLDEEVVAMIERASPLPTPPADMGGERINFTVPILFDQR